MIQSIDRLKYEPVGEWGKVLGLEQITTDATLRKRIDTFCNGDENAIDKWVSALSAEWLGELPDGHVGSVYCDGHVRVYHGKKPTYCVVLSAVSDYYVNDRSGH